MRQRGTVFILTLAVLAGLIALIAQLAITHRMSLRAQANRMEDRQARLMAESAIQRAIADLQKADLAKSSPSDSWASLGSAGADSFKVGDDYFRIQILDENSRVNINSATEDQLKKLPLTPNQIASLLDWRESGKSPRAQGAKDEYYNELPDPYNAKLEPFDCIEELLLVKDFTPDALYQPSQLPDSTGQVLSDLITVDSSSNDKNPDGKEKLDANTSTSKQMQDAGMPKALADAVVQGKRQNYKKMGDILNIQRMTKQGAHTILDLLSIGKPAAHSGMLNVNTVSDTAIRSLPNVTPEMASAIMGRQGAGYATLGELTDVPGIELPALAKICDSLCVSSRSFNVRAVGVSGSTYYAIEATLMVGDDHQVTVTRVQPQSFWSAQRRWGWGEKASKETVLDFK